MLTIHCEFFCTPRLLVCFTLGFVPYAFLSTLFSVFVNKIGDQKDSNREDEDKVKDNI